jgi:hypothetical protein
MSEPVAPTKRRRLPSTRWMVALVVVVLVVTVLPRLFLWEQGSARRQADGVVDSTAVALAAITAEHRHDSAAALVRLVDGQVGSSVLDASTDIDGRGTTVVVQLEASAGNGGLSGQASVVTCFAYDVRRTGPAPSATAIGCPSSPPLVLPSPPPSPSLSDLGQTVPAAINALPAPARSDLAAVRAAVAGVVKTPGASIDATDEDGVIGLSVRRGRGSSLQCDFIRLAPTVQIWTVATIEAQPGEGGCTADDAARGLDQEPPH